MFPGTVLEGDLGSHGHIEALKASLDNAGTVVYKALKTFPCGRARIEGAKTSLAGMETTATNEGKWKAGLAEFLQFGDSFDKVCGELGSMLVAGAVRPKSPVLSAEQIAMLKAALVQHVPLPGVSTQAEGDGFAACCGRIRCLSLATTLLRALAGAGDEARIVPLISEVEQCLSLAKTLKSVGALPT